MVDNVPSASEWMTQCEHLHTRRGHRVAYRRRGSGPSVLLLHGFPTWSYDYAAVATDLARDHDVVTVDFLGYGASDKPAPHDYSVTESADIVEDLMAHLRLTSVDLIVHDYGGIVGQEIADRQLGGRLPFTVDSLTILNCGIVYSAYRPTRLQKLLNTPVLGRLIAAQISATTLRKGLAAVWGDTKLTDAEFDELWEGISRDSGHKLAHLLIRYNTERARHHRRWEAALAAWDRPLHLVWGLSDPVSGQHVLWEATRLLPQATITELAGVGHFPQTEAPDAVVAALRSSS
ncbi:alpha/beta fold hydrolase [Mycolicibacterium rhodesiae]|uniref:AB hydrolase-1 domain-containing protein n=1 Tax=Mycolicibacterium rhodesiae TaxID=36814 RepID=A0A1X0IP89_MYCRH|nr:alpha/beta hydrolase [Mycolicibacterium rhodesiae]MCV7344294.1 alpha/beta hydrolase [Mycolicibacterium rhodesiae]ORB50161.1 hypothetical protein BST42_20655 [Mycolicibacterium rhodesiae]